MPRFDSRRVTLGAALFALGALCVALVWAMYAGGQRAASRPSPTSAPSASVEPVTPAPVAEFPAPESLPQAAPDVPGQVEPLLAPIVSPDLPSTAVRFVDPTGELGVEATVMLGSPGVWPFVVTRTDVTGALELPEVEVDTYQGHGINRYEVFARAVAGPQGLAFWGEYDMPRAQEGAAEETRPHGHLLPMRAAGDLKFRLQDELGHPVWGAQLRVSRQSVGLLHLTSTSDEGGYAVVPRLPFGEYQVHIIAQGMDRHEIAVEHLRATPELVVSLATRGAGRRALGGSGLKVRRQAGTLAWDWPQLDLSQPPAVGEPVAVPLPPIPGQSPSALPAGADPLAAPVPGGAPLPNETPAPTSIAAANSAPPSGPIQPVYVVDERGSPVTGALVEVWKGGRRQFTGLSEGRRPVMARVAPGSTVLAFAPGWGEARAVQRGSEWHAQLQEGAAMGDVPGRVADPRAVEAILGAALVEDGGLWLVDVREPKCPAAQAGIERGARLVYLRATGRTHEAVVDQLGDYVRVVIGP